MSATTIKICSSCGRGLADAEFSCPICGGAARIDAQDASAQPVDRPFARLFAAIFSMGAACFAWFIFEVFRSRIALAAIPALLVLAVASLASRRFVGLVLSAAFLSGVAALMIFLAGGYLVLLALSMR